VPQTKTMVCSGNPHSSLVRVSARNISLSEVLVCFVDGNSVGDGMYISSDVVACPIPNLRPGKYELIVRKDITRSASETPGYLISPVNVVCIPRPTLLSVHLNPPESVKGFFSQAASYPRRYVGHVLRISILNLVAGADVTCDLIAPKGLQRETVLATMDTKQTVHCALSSVVPDSLHNLRIFVGDVANGFCLVDSQICLSSDLLLAGGSVDSIDLSVCGNDTVLQAKSDPYSELESVVFSRTINSMWPRIGSAAGGSEIEITSDSFDGRNSYECLFRGGTGEVPAFDVSTNVDIEREGLTVRADAYLLSSKRLKCTAPAAVPGNATVLVYGRYLDNGILFQSWWCCGKFSFIPVFRLLTVQPKYIVQSGGTLVYMQTTLLPSEWTSAGLAPTAAGTELLCRFGTDFTVAKIVSDSSVACISPAVATATVAVSLGLQGEQLTNAFPVSVFPASLLSAGYSTEPIVVPSFGSWRGNTPVSVSMPSKFSEALLSPRCLFGSSAVVGVLNQTGGTLLCVTPPSADVGQVAVYVFDSARQNEIGFNRDSSKVFAGYFHYELPATATDCKPAFVTQAERSQTLLITGGNFRDSASLSCVVTCGHGHSGVFTVLAEIWLPAQWLSAHLLSCDVILPRACLSVQNLRIQVSNNGVDASFADSAVMVEIVSSNAIISVAPTTGFQNGGTPVLFVFRQYQASSVMCLFASNVSSFETPAYRLTDSTFLCTSPPSSSSEEHTLSIRDISAATLYSAPFEYVPSPSVINCSQTTIYVNSQVNVLFDIDVPFRSSTASTFVGRFRKQSNNDDILERAVCELGPHQVQPSQYSTLRCTVVAPSTESFLYLDLSANNGADFLLGVYTLRVVPRSFVVGFAPQTFMSVGGESIVLSIQSDVPAFGMSCVFEMFPSNINLMSTSAGVALRKWTVPTSVQSLSTAVCVSPYLFSSVADEVNSVSQDYRSFSTFLNFSVTARNGLVLMEPVTVPIMHIPQPTQASKSHLLAGIVNDVVVSWPAEPILTSLRSVQNLVCVFGEGVAISTLKLINTTSGVCSLQPLKMTLVNSVYIAGAVATYPLYIRPSSSIYSVEAISTAPVSSNTLMLSVTAINFTNINVNASAVNFEGRTSVQFSFDLAVVAACAVSADMFCRSSQASVSTLKDDILFISGCAVTCIVYDVLQDTRTVVLELCSDETCSVPVIAVPMVVRFAASVFAVSDVCRLDSK
jgi:hypothetical protein